MTNSRRLTAADSWFLYMEGPTMHLHVTGLMLLDPASAPEPFDRSRFRALLEARLDRLDSLRTKIIPVPYGIDHPVLVEVDVHIDDHLEYAELPGKPGSKKAERSLRSVLDEFCSSPLDRSRPLWQMLYVEGLTGGRIALAAKLHHAIVDGVSGVDFMGELLDLEPDAPVRAPIEDDVDPADGHGADEGDPDDEDPGEPSRNEIILDAITNRMVDPLRSARAMTRTGTSVFNAVGAALSGRGSSSDRAAPFAAPHTSINGSLTPARSVAFTSLRLEDVKELRRLHAVTLNDVLLAAVSSALREHLQTHDEVPERPLVAAVPVSVHDPASPDSAISTNQVSNMFVNLPVHLSDPVQRLMAVHRSAMGAKAIQGAMGPEMLGDLMDLIPPPVLSAATSAFVGSRISDRIPPTHSVIVSNVPGPDFPLYLGGAEVVGMYPFGPLMEGSGLNITVLSHNGRLDLGIIACPDLVPDVDQVLAGIESGLDELRRGPVAT